MKNENIIEAIHELTTNFLTKAGIEPNSLYVGHEEFDSILETFPMAVSSIQGFGERCEKGKVGTLNGLKTYLIGNKNHLSVGMTIE